LPSRYTVKRKQKILLMPCRKKLAVRWADHNLICLFANSGYP